MVEAATILRNLIDSNLLEPDKETANVLVTFLEDASLVNVPFFPVALDRLRDGAPEAFISVHAALSKYWGADGS